MAAKAVTGGWSARSKARSGGYGADRSGWGGTRCRPQRGGGGGASLLLLILPMLLMLLAGEGGGGIRNVRKLEWRNLVQRTFGTNS